MTRVSLDTQIIIAILTNNLSGHRSPEEWRAIREITADIDASAAVLVLPTLIFTELLPSHHGNAKDLTVAIAERAGELRDAGRLASGRRLKTPDAVFIATAELSGCRCLYSSDPDIYGATGARIPLLKPASSQLSLLPAEAFPLDWAGV